MEVKSFPDALRLSRKLKDWSQDRVAEEVGASQQTVAGWEKGRSSPRPDAYTKLVKLFGVGSLVAQYPPRGSDLAVPRAAHAEYVSERHKPYAAAEADRPPALFSMEQKAPPKLAPDQRAIQMALIRELPGHLHPHVGAHLTYRDSSYPATYLSAKLCVVVAPIHVPTLSATHNLSGRKERMQSMVQSAVVHATRNAMRQLTVLRAILANEAESDMRQYLAIATPAHSPIGLDNMIPPRIEDEAYLLNLRCHFSNTPAMTAAIIQNYESPFDENEEYFDEEIPD